MLEIILLIWLILWLFNAYVVFVRQDIKNIVNAVVLVLLLVWLFLRLFGAVNLPTYIR